ncbi:MAG: Gar1/Naf1 family protein [Nitrososphaerota archaeon]|nr:Gar1/Naf1 family protein [Candidatus Bathyarchaeota archaeon]MDW8048986.1 Gar1/Naf1 family protein [Nitrososphaerota archaeon]
MRRIGRVLHIGPSGKAIVKADRIPRIGDIVVDEKKRRVGVVSDIIGPTCSPYVEVDVKIKKPENLVEKVLHVLPQSKESVKGRRK